MIEAIFFLLQLLGAWFLLAIFVGFTWTLTRGGARLRYRGPDTEPSPSLVSARPYDVGAAELEEWFAR